MKNTTVLDAISQLVEKAHQVTSTLKNQEGYSANLSEDFNFLKNI